MRHVHLHRPRLAAVAMAVSLIGVFLFATSAQARVSDDQHILVISTDSAQRSAPTVLGWGPIHAKGTDKVISDTKDQFVFPRGSIFITHKPQGSSDSFDRATCASRFREHGTYWLTGGTGAYAGATGHGLYYVNVLAVGCDQSAPPNPFLLQIRAVGPLHL